MHFCKIIRLFLVVFTTFNIASCAINEIKIGENNQNNIADLEKKQISGRLALHIAAETGAFEQPPRQFSGAFELTGNRQMGELVFLTPLGSIAAQLSWRAQSAKLTTDGQTREFGDLGALLRQVTGADLPVDGLFAWMNGQTFDVPGWDVDLSRHNEGRISAKRQSPPPALDLRIVLER